MKTAFRTLPRPEIDGRSRLVSAGAAVLIQVAVLALLLAVKEPEFVRSGPAGWAFGPPGELGDAGGGGGGGDVIIQLPAPPAADAAPDLPAVPDLVAPEVPKLEVPMVSAEFAAPPLDACVAPCGVPVPGMGAGSGGGAGSGRGSGSGAGSGLGTGSGTGGSGAGGGGSGIRPPAPLTILIPPQATPAVRGKAATVRLQVDSLGTVRDAEVVASSGDKGYDQKLRSVAMGWRFRPARDAANRPIAYPFEVSLKF